MTYFFMDLHQGFGFLYADIGPYLMLILFFFFALAPLWVFQFTTQATRQLIRSNLAGRQPIAIWHREGFFFCIRTKQHRALRLGGAKGQVSSEVFEFHPFCFL
jgi:hypothetical protein